MNNKNQPYEVERWALSQRLGPRRHAHKLLLLTLAVNADANGYSFHSQTSLGEQCDLARQTVNSHLATLEAEGYIAHRSCFDHHGRQTSCDYLVLFRDGLTWPDGAHAGQAQPALEPTIAVRHQVSEADDAPCRATATGTVARTGHLEETTEEPEQESVQETNARGSGDTGTEEEAKDRLFGLAHYIAGLGQRGVLKPEWPSRTSRSRSGRLLGLGT